MFTELSNVFIVILTATISAIVASPMMIRLAQRIHLVDMPGAATHKKHQVETPIAGGLVILVSLMITLGILQLQLSNEVRGILLGTLVMMLWGLIDDRFNLRPSHKIFGQLLAALIVIGFGVQVHITKIDWLDFLITLFWFIGITNAFNFVDSMDGLAVGLAGIASAFFMLVTLDSAQPELAFLSAAFMGTMIGCFFFNAPPARMFLGDSGSLMLGFSLAAIGIAYTPAQAGLPQGVSWFVPILVLGVPIFDMALVVVSRFRKRRPIYLANTDHVYHRLEQYGFKPNRAVAAMHVTAIILGLLAFITLDMGIFAANLIFLVVVLIALVILFMFEKYLSEEQSSPM
jgi:UDP-GlcNAc:undecaprenyl-phosphate GlcNAc-1-phosphate transferase